MATRFAMRVSHLLPIVAALSLTVCSSIIRATTPERSLLRGGVRATQAGDTSRYVIHVSVDGLRPDAVRRLGAGGAPHFYRLRIEGAYTENARTDFDYSVTLPNHACELTSRPVLGPGGHGLSLNNDDGRTLAEIHGSYVAGVFDVVHDNGLTTGMYVSKSKFALFDRSWDETNGASDVTGIDDGRDKIDTFVYDSSTAALLDAFILNMNEAPHNYAFIHLADPDASGHSNGWESVQYLESIVKVDGLLGRIFDLIDGDPRLAGRTYVVVAADHGGTGGEHSDATAPLCYTVPLYVWGPGVPAGSDLYLLNPSTRLDPGSERPPYSAVCEPIRNGEAANLALDLLALPSVNGSSIDGAQDCEAILPGGEDALPLVSITSPAADTSLPYPSGVVIEATAEAGTGTIARVEFFDNYVELGADSIGPYTYAWSGIPLGSYHLTARAVRTDGAAATAGVDLRIVSTTAAPEERLAPPQPPRVYPNPFERVSTIEFSLSSSDAVELEVYDLLGRRVGTVFSGCLEEGVHELRFDGAGYSPGLYFLQLRSGGTVQTAKLMILR